MTLTFGSLFSGIGGLDLGLERSGMKCLWQCEIDTYARERVLKHRFPGVKIYDDICSINTATLAPVDCLCGGFPCQDVSSNGHRRGIKEGTRSGLWFEYKRIIRALRPRYVIAENVSALLARGGGIGIVLSDLASLGYDAEWQVLSSFAFGATHLRERVFVVAYPSSIGRKAPEIFNRASFENTRISREHRCASDQAARWLSFAGVCRGEDGPPNWVDRLRCCGNGVDPHVAESVGRMVVAHSEATA